VVCVTYLFSATPLVRLSSVAGTPVYRPRSDWRAARLGRAQLQLPEATVLGRGCHQRW